MILRGDEVVLIYKILMEIWEVFKIGSFCCIIFSEMKINMWLEKKYFSDWFVC